MSHIQAFFGSKGFLLALTVLSMGGVMSVSAENDTSAPLTALNQPAYAAKLATGVQAYRDGNYLLAQKALTPLHSQHPENSKITYYLAITEAQLGRFQQAKQLYQEIVALDPNSNAAKLAAQGLAYLPSEAGMDLPPRFQAVQTGQPALRNQTATVHPATGQVAQQPAPTMTPQDWMAWQMMMGQNGMGGSGAGGMGMMPSMMPGMIPGMLPGGTGTGNIDPNMMSTMMMNQMMQNMTLGGGSDENH